MPPTMLLNSLESIRRRVRTLSVVFGIGVVVSAAAALVVLVVLLDYALDLPPIPRIFVILLALATLGYAMARWIVKPLLAKLSLTDVASRLEAAFPQFDDRLRSTVDFLGGRVPGSEMMQARVVDETTKLAGTINLGGAIVTRPVWYSAGSGVGAILLLALLTALLSPQYRQIALSRLFSPFSGMAWPKSVQIDLVGDVPTRVPLGQHVDLKMKLSKGDRVSAKAIVYYQYGEMLNGQPSFTGPVQQEYMSRGEGGAYGSSLDTRTESGQNAAAGLMRIWIKSGDDEVHIPDITVVPRLAIKSVTATITPPAYVGDARTTVFDLTKSGALMPIGAKIKLDVTFNKALRSKPQDVAIEPADATMSVPQFTSTPIDGGLSDVWEARQSLRFHIRATDTDGFTNSALEEYEMIVRPDQNPSVQIENPRRNEERTAISTIPLQGLAEDDYGIQSLKLQVDRLGDKTHWEIPLVADAKPLPNISWSRRDNSGDRLRFSMDYKWDLSQLKDANLKPGDVLEYFLTVQDNFNLDNQTHPPVPSGHLRISIISQEDLTSKVIEDLRQVKDHIGEIKTSQDRTRTQTQSLRDDTKNKPQLDAADKQAADRLANQQATAATQAKQLAGKLDEIQNRLDENKSTAQELKDLARDVKSDLNQSAETNMKDAAAQIGQANQPTTPQQQRNEQLSKAQENQQNASNRLQQAWIAWRISARWRRRSIV